MVRLDGNRGFPYIGEPRSQDQPPTGKELAPWTGHVELDTPDIADWKDDQ